MILLMAELLRDLWPAALRILSIYMSQNRVSTLGSKNMVWARILEFPMYIGI